MEYYYVVICAIAKDEGRYIEEWIKHHIQIGVDLIVIYDNYSKVSLKYMLRSYITNKKVRVIDCKIDITPQLKAYNHCLYEMNNKAEWIAFIDIDEFIILHKHVTIREFLNSYIEFQGVCLNWLTYTASGHITASRQPVMERFTEHLPFNHFINTHVKSIIRPKYVANIGNPHFANFDFGYHAVNENKIPVNGAFSNFSNTLAQINHYLTKSLEEWIVKVNRGRSDTLLKRSMSYFWQLNESMSSLKGDIAFNNSRSFCPNNLGFNNFNDTVFGNFVGYITQVRLKKEQYLPDQENGYESCDSYILFLALFSLWAKSDAAETEAYEELQKKCDEIIRADFGEVVKFQASKIGILVCCLFAQKVIEEPLDLINYFDSHFYWEAFPEYLDSDFSKSIYFTCYIAGRLYTAEYMNRGEDYENILVKAINFFTQTDIRLVYRRDTFYDNKETFFSLQIYLYISFLYCIAELTSCFIINSKIKIILEIIESLFEQKRKELDLSGKNKLAFVLIELLFAQSLLSAFNVSKVKSLKKRALQLITKSCNTLISKRQLNSKKENLILSTLISICFLEEDARNIVLKKFSEILNAGNLLKKENPSGLKEIIHLLASCLNIKVTKKRWLATYTQLVIQLMAIKELSLPSEINNDL